MKGALPYLLVGAGGFCGAIARFAVSRIFHWEGTEFPFATFIINISGSFFLGVLGYVAYYVKVVEPDHLRYALGIGFLGAYTTFSTFELETYHLLKGNAFMTAAGYVALSVFVGLIAVRFGVEWGKFIMKFV